MRLAKIENGVVVNVSLAAPGQAIPEGWVDAKDAGPGWAFDGANFVKPVSAAPSAEELREGKKLSFAQLLIGLVAEKWITEAEGEDWLSGMLPAPVEALIASLPAEHRFPARARAMRPSEVLRLDPMVALLGAAQGKTDADLDAFFATYAVV